MLFLSTDINECTLLNPCEQLCTNTLGSFSCGCNGGYRLAGNGRLCNGTKNQITHKHHYNNYTECIIITPVNNADFFKFGVCSS